MVVARHGAAAHGIGSVVGKVLRGNPLRALEKGLENKGAHEVKKLLSLASKGPYTSKSLESMEI